MIDVTHINKSPLGSLILFKHLNSSRGQKKFENHTPRVKPFPLLAIALDLLMYPRSAREKGREVYQETSGKFSHSQKRATGSLSLFSLWSLMYLNGLPGTAATVFLPA